jgi:hypothetical protein
MVCQSNEKQSFSLKNNGMMKQKCLTEMNRLDKTNDAIKKDHTE